MSWLVLHVGAWSALLVSRGSAAGSGHSRASLVRSHDAAMSRLMYGQSPEDGVSTTTTEAPEAPVPREIDPLGRCIIPMWNSRDFVCQEHIDVSSFNMFEDHRGRVRKRLEDGQDCTVQCPDPRYWQVVQEAELYPTIRCTRGVLKTQAGGIVKEVSCATGSAFKCSLLLLVLMVLLGPCIAWKSITKAAPPPPDPAARPIEIVDEPGSPAAEASAPGGGG